MSDALTQETLRAQLRTHWLGHEMVVLSSVDSTNDEVVRLARPGRDHGLLVVADEQLAGRGRLGRSWQSPPGENLYFSVLLRPTWPPTSMPPVSLVTAVGVVKGLQQLVEQPLVVKWPNDVLCGGKKLTGILVESSLDSRAVHRVVIGVGLNVNQQGFAGDLQQTATSLRLQTRTRLGRAAVLCAVLAPLERCLDALLAGKTSTLLQQWVELAASWLGTRVRVCGGSRDVCGVALGLTADGALRLRDDQGAEQVIVAGDVHVI